MRIPGLDGLRALSITIVLLCHLSIVNHLNLPAFLSGSFFDGGLGVRLFFTISAYLITNIILNELKTQPRFDFCSFYIRRAAKLLPVLYLYLLYLVMYASFTGVTYSRHAILRALTFTTLHHSMVNLNATAHTWSLSVEELFYITWVPFIVWVFHKTNRYYWLTGVFLGVITLSPILRAYNIFITLPEWQRKLPFLPTYYIPVIEEFTFFAIGCLVAIKKETFQNLIKNYTAVKRNLLKIIGWFLTFAPTALIQMYQYTPTFKIFGPTFQSVGIGILILLITNPKFKENRFFDHPWVTKVGLATYSIYIIQQSFFWNINDGPIKLGIFAVPLAILSGILVYKYVEAPLNRLIRLAYAKRLITLRQSLLKF